MKLISDYFSWCEGGRKSSIDPGDRVSSCASEEEEEATVEIRTTDKNERPLYQRKKKKERPPELGQMGNNEIQIYRDFLTFYQQLKGNFVNLYLGWGEAGWNKIHTHPKPDSGF